MSFLKKFIYKVLSIQEKFLTMRLQKTIGIKNVSKHKKITQAGCLLTLDSIAESEKNKMEEELELILKSSHYDPLEVLEYIKKHDTKVFFINSAKFLHLIKENEGFIYPQKGLKALYLSFLTEQKISFNTSGMFLLSSKNINKYYFIYHFYNWYAFNHGIIGIDSESQNLLNKYLDNDSQAEIENLQLADIYKLKDAIKQDKAAIEFVFKLCQKSEASKKALDKLKNEGANI